MTRSSIQLPPQTSPSTKATSGFTHRTLVVVEAPSEVKVVVIQLIVVDAAVHHITATKGNIQEDLYIHKGDILYHQV
jgi:hypothetical protein